MSETDACAICNQRGFVRWTTFSAEPDTVALLGLPRPEARVDLRVCHGCYISATAHVLDRLGLPRVVPGAQLQLPLGK